MHAGTTWFLPYIESERISRNSQKVVLPSLTTCWITIRFNWANSPWNGTPSSILMFKWTSWTPSKDCLICAVYYSCTFCPRLKNLNLNLCPHIRVHRPRGRPRDILAKPPTWCCLWACYTTTVHCQRRKMLVTQCRAARSSFFWVYIIIRQCYCWTVTMADTIM